jgi:hypothetical protein
MRHTATIENIDAKLLFEQKCDLLDVIGFLESHYDDYPISLPKKIQSLGGILHILDDITDQIEKD